MVNDVNITNVIKRLQSEFTRLCIYTKVSVMSVTFDTQYRRTRGVFSVYC